jgi:hypothetical protein
MPQIFHPSMNTISRATIFGAVFILAAGLWLLMTVVRSPYMSGVGVIKPQPVPFSHGIILPSAASIAGIAIRASRIRRLPAFRRRRHA